MSKGTVKSGMACLSTDGGDHHQYVLQEMSALLAHESLTDVTLYCRDSGNATISRTRTIHVHHRVLAAVSPLLRRIIPAVTASTETRCHIILPDFPSSTVRRLLDILYTGRCNKKLSAQDLDKLSDCASALGITLDAAVTSLKGGADSASKRSSSSSSAKTNVKLGGSTQGSGTKPLSQRLQEDQPRVYCLCRGPESPGMIGCDFCDEWYHAKCLTLTKADVQELASVKNWACPRCDYNLTVQAKKQQKQGASGSPSRETRTKAADNSENKNDRVSKKTSSDAAPNAKPEAENVSANDSKNKAKTVAKPSSEGGGGAGLKRVHYKPQNTPKAVTNHSGTSKVEKNVKESKEKDVGAQKISPVNAIGTEGVGSNSEKHADAISDEFPEQAAVDEDQEGLEGQCSPLSVDLVDIKSDTSHGWRQKPSGSEVWKLDRSLIKRKPGPRKKPASDDASTPVQTDKAVLEPAPVQGSTSQGEDSVVPMKKKKGRPGRPPKNPQPAKPQDSTDSESVQPTTTNSSSTTPTDGDEPKASKGSSQDLTKSVTPKRKSTEGGKKRASSSSSRTNLDSVKKLKTTAGSINSPQPQDFTLPEEWKPMLKKEIGSENTNFTASTVKEAKKLIAESKPPTDFIGPQSHANNSAGDTSSETSSNTSEKTESSESSEDIPLSITKSPSKTNKSNTSKGKEKTETTSHESRDKNDVINDASKEVPPKPSDKEGKEFTDDSLSSGNKKSTNSSKNETAPASENAEKEPAISSDTSTTGEVKDKPRVAKPGPKSRKKKSLESDDSGVVTSSGRDTDMNTTKAHHSSPKAVDSEMGELHFCYICKSIFLTKSAKKKHDEERH